MFERQLNNSADKLQNEVTLFSFQLIIAGCRGCTIRFHRFTHPRARTSLTSGGGYTEACTTPICATCHWQYKGKTNRRDRGVSSPGSCQYQEAGFTYIARLDLRGIAFLSLLKY